MAIVTLSRQLGSGDTAIAERLSARLGYTLVDRAKISEAGERYGLIKSEELDRVDEKPPGFFERFFQDRHAIYVDLLQSIIYDFAHLGNVIIVGRGSHLLLKEVPCAVHVYVVAPFERRVATVMQELGLERAAAEVLIRQSDRDKTGYMKYFFDAEWADPLRYDLVLNTSKLGVEVAVEAIVAAVRSPEIREAEQSSREILDKLALSKRVRAALFAKGGINTRHILIAVPTAGVVHLKGSVNSEQERLRAEEIAAEVEGVRQVVNDLSVILIMPGEGW